MRFTEVETYLMCIRCNDETEHTVLYKGDKIMRVQCKNCCLELSLSKDYNFTRYLMELLERTMTKPSRVSDEFRRDFKQFLKSLPKRAVSKPFRVSKEYKQYKKILKKKDCVKC